MNNEPLNRTMNKIVSLSGIGVSFTIALALIIQSVGQVNIIITELSYAQQNQFYAAAVRSQRLGATTQGTMEPSSDTPKETNRIIVKYNEAKLPPGLSVAQAHANLEKAEGLKKVLDINGINAVVYEVNEDNTAREVVDRLIAKDKGKDTIEYVEVDMYAIPAYQPNDPLFSTEWHINKIEAPKAWDVTRGENVTVAVLDAGVNCTHPDLAAHCVPGWNVASNNSNTTDIHGHGTGVASTLGQIGDNAEGYAGVAYNIKIMPVRLTDDPTNQGVPCSNIANGIVYAADHGAKVASNSYYVYGCSVIVDAANYMAGKGGIYVRSAGNNGQQLFDLNDGNVIIASATDNNDTVTSWSNYGNLIDIAAPGLGVPCIWSNSYTTCWGTSFATPIVSGILALEYSVNPQLSATQAKSILFSTADDLGDPGWDQYYGYGRVNAAKAVAAAQAASGTRDIIAPSIPTNLRTTNIAYNSVALAWNASTDDNSGVASYGVYRNGTKLTSVSGTTYIDTAVSPETAYTYTVTATDGGGNTSAQSSSISLTTPEIPFIISSYSVPTKTDTTATVVTTLTKPGTITVKYGTTASNLNLTAQSATSNTTHSVTLTSLTGNTTYYYQITATDGTNTNTSPISNFKTTRAKGGKR